jgi:hypothetical protein
LIKCITIANVITGGTGGTGTTGIIGSISTNPQERYALFDPYVGSVITAVLATLFALARGSYHAIGVIAMYIEVHSQSVTAGRHGAAVQFNKPPHQRKAAEP